MEIYILVIVLLGKRIISYKKLSEYIDGNFFTQYDDMINKLQSHMCKYGVGVDCICTPIKTLYEKSCESKL